MKKNLLFCVLIMSIFYQAHAADSKPDLNALLSAAEKDDKQSQLEYGKAILNESRDKAALWIQKSEDQGSVEALFWLGYAGLGKEQPIFYYKKAREKWPPKEYNDFMATIFFGARYFHDHV